VKVRTIYMDDALWDAIQEVAGRLGPTSGAALVRQMCLEGLAKRGIRFVAREPNGAGGGETGARPGGEAAVAGATGPAAGVQNL
jgi:hypothetical protein